MSNEPKQAITMQTGVSCSFVSQFDVTVDVCVLASGGSLGSILFDTSGKR